MNARERRRLERAAHHEAGHVVAAYLLGLPIGVASIVPDPDAGTVGHARRAVPPADRPKGLIGADEQRQLELEIIATLAGPLAERWSGGANVKAPDQADAQRARRLAARVNPDPFEDDPHLAWLRARAATMRHRPDYRAALEAVAAALAERRELGGEEVRQIIKDAIRGQRVE
jgi:hypothetical protein